MTRSERGPLWHLEGKGSDGSRWSFSTRRQTSSEAVMAAHVCGYEGEDLVAKVEEETHAGHGHAHH